MVEIARNYGRRPTKRREIARSQDISSGYLEAILLALRGARLVSAVRGSEGGFALARPPSAITMLDMVLALEGSIAPVDCVERPGSCDRSGCGAHMGWNKLYQAQLSALSSVSLTDLLAAQTHSPSYEI
jgi:Rrf2 family protein